jgi:glucosamine--fructose-6-phosphate aminotransferase (isomerizing)
LQVTRQVAYLEDGDVVEIRPHQVRIQDANGRTVQRAAVQSQLSADAVELGPYRHFMQKEYLSNPEQSPIRSKWSLPEASSALNFSGADAPDASPGRAR